MRNREKIRQMKEYIPEGNTGNPLNSVPENGDGTAFKEKYSPLSEFWPIVGLHLEALELLSKKVRYSDLSGDEREALLIYSLWTEDPIKVTEITKDIGFDERRINRYVDLAEYELKGFSNALVDVINGLKLDHIDLGISSSAKGAKEVSEVQREIEGISTGIGSLPKIKAIYGNSEVLTPSNRTTQTYDHPIPTRDQEKIIFEHLLKGSTLEALFQDGDFRSTINEDDLYGWRRVLAESKTVEDIIVNTTLRFVDVIARAYQNQGVSHLDLINAGNIGVMTAMQRYQVEGPARFVGYAKYAIRGEIIKAVKNVADIKMPELVRQDLGKVFWVKEAFQTVLGRDPTIEELRIQLLANTNLSVRRIDTALEALQQKTVRSINETLTPEGEDELGDFVPDKTVDIEAEVIADESRKELKRDVHRALHEYLTERERGIVMRLYGIGYRIEKSLEEVEQVTGIAREEIEIIRERAFVRLRKEEILRSHWDGLTDIPYFVYHASAEKAAFRLGLFGEGYMERERLKKALLQTPEDTIDPQLTETKAVEADVVIESTEQASIKTITEKIVTLQSQGLNNAEIAENLGVKVAVVYANLLGIEREKKRRERKTAKVSSVQAKKEKPESLISKVKRLRNQGYNNQQITETTKTTYGAVARCAIRLLKKGEIKPLHKFGDISKNATSKKELAKENLTSRAVTVKEMLERGCNYSEIGKALGITSKGVSSFISRMRVEGQLEPRSEQQKKYEIYCNRVKELFRQGKSYAAITRALSTSSESISRNAISRTVKKLMASGELEQPKTREEMRQEAISEETEQVKQYLEEHPRPSYKDGFRRIFEARERRPQGKRPETTEFERQVKGSRDQGLTNKEIATRMATTLVRVQMAVHNLILAGELEPRYIVRNSKERAKKIAEAKEFKEKVKELGLQGLDYIQIAEKLGDSVPRVWSHMWRMDKSGEVKFKHLQFKPINKIGYIDKNSLTPVGKVYETVTEMRKKGHSNAEIAKVLDLPVHRIECYASNLIRAGLIEPKMGGEKRKKEKTELQSKIVELRNQGYGNKEIAKRLNISVNMADNHAKELIAAGVIKPMLKPKNRVDVKIR